MFLRVGLNVNQILEVTSMAHLSNYKVILYCQPDGSWAAYVPAIPGCHAIMSTREEVLAELKNVFNMIREEDIL